MSQIGNRFLFLKLSRPENLGFRDAPNIDPDKLKVMVNGFILAHWGFKEILISQQMDDKIYDFVHKIILLRGIRWAKGWGDVEGDARLLNEMRELCRSRAKLHDRTEVLPEDLDFFKDLAYETIPNCSNLYKIYKGLAHNHDNNKWTKEILDHCIRFKMTTLVKKEIRKVGLDKKNMREVEFHTFNDEWMTFCKPFLDKLEDSYVEEEEQDTDMAESDKSELEQKMDVVQNICRGYNNEAFTTDDLVLAVTEKDNFCKATKEDVIKILDFFEKNKRVERVTPGAEMWYFVDKPAVDKKAKPKPSEIKKKKTLDEAVDFESLNEQAAGERR